MLTYRAIIINKQTGERKVLKLGRSGSIVQACNQADAKCPQGWRVYDVSKAYLTHA